MRDTNRWEAKQKKWYELKEETDVNEGKGGWATSGSA
jgi:hypothetical protein